MMPLKKSRDDLNISRRPVKVGVAQYASVGFNLEACISKLSSVCEEASAQGVQFLLFPEAFLTGYPFGGTLNVIFGHRGIEGRKLYQMWWEAAVELPGPVTLQLGQIANKNNLYLVVGVIEKELSSFSMFCSVVFFSNDGTYLGKHRKLVPTAYERLTWAAGDGSTMPVFDTPDVGKFGAVICWENYMPLLRAYMYSQGIQIYCAPVADSSDNWQSVMRSVALEGRCFVLNCCQFVRRSDFPPDTEFPTELDNPDPNLLLAKGGSVIISPMGQILAGPNFESECLLVAEIDLNDVLRGKYDLDVTGHYSRPDIFSLYVNTKANSNVVIRKQESSDEISAKSPPSN